MQWTSIRLELGCTRDHPKGSASRIYLLRLPLTDAGAIDGHAIENHPERATVRRIWPSEPDRSGRVVPGREGWAFDFGAAGEGPGTALLAKDARLIEGATVDVVERGGARQPFRVADLRALRYLPDDPDI